MYKWTDYIKQKLEAREVPPSDSSWDRLDSLLQKEQIKSKQKSWFSIAASIFLLIIIRFALFPLFQVKNDNPVVYTKQPTKRDTSSLDIPSNNIKTSLPSIDKHDIVKSTSNTKKEKAIPSNDMIEKQEILPPTQQEPLSLAETKVPPTKTSEEYLIIAMKKRNSNTKNYTNTGINIDRVKLLDNLEEEIFIQENPLLLDRIFNEFKNIQIALINKNNE